MKVALFVVHYSPLKERKARLEEAISKLKLSNFWVTEDCIKFDEDLFSSINQPFGVSQRLIAMDRSNNSRSIVNSRLKVRIEGFFLLFASLFLEKKLLYLTDNPFPEKEPNRILELSLMHYQCLKMACDLKLDWALVVEDDAIIDVENVEKIIQNVGSLKFSKPAWYNLSAGANLNRTKSDPRPDSLGMFRVRPWATRCSSGYLINSKFFHSARQLLEQDGLPNWTAIDVIYQIIMRKLRAVVYWQDPASILQGSELGIYPSNLKKTKDYE